MTDLVSPAHRSTAGRLRSSSAPFAGRDLVRLWQLDEPVPALWVDAALGGLPGYRPLVEAPGRDLDAWMVGEVLAPASPLLDAAEAALSTPPPRRAVASTGRSWRPSPRATGPSAPSPGSPVSPRGRSRRPLGALERAGLVAQVADPLRSRRDAYELASPHLRTWLTIIAPHRVALQAGGRPPRSGTACGTTWRHRCSAAVGGRGGAPPWRVRRAAGSVRSTSARHDRLRSGEPHQPRGRPRRQAAAPSSPGRGQAAPARAQRPRPAPPGARPDGSAGRTTGPRLRGPGRTQVAREPDVVYVAAVGGLRVRRSAARPQSRSVTEVSASASSVSISSGSNSSWRVNRPLAGEPRWRQGVGGQHHRRGRVRRPLARGEPPLVGEHRAGPVAAVVGAVALGPAEQVVRSLGVADGQPGHGVLARLGGRHPRAVGDAAHTAAVQHERAVPLGQSLAAGLAHHHAGQHGVVPVHGPAVLGREGVGHVADDVGEPGGRELPVGPLVAEQLGEGDGAAQAVADRGRAGEQGEGPRRRRRGGPRGSRPAASAGRAPSRWPARPPATSSRRSPGRGAEPAVPHAGGDVGDDVGIELVLLDPVGQVVLVPRAVGALQVGQPLEGALGLAVAPRPA